MRTSYTLSRDAAYGSSTKFTQKIQAVISGALSWNKLEPEYTKIYEDAYTEQQIDDILAFYKSPTGQVMVEKIR